MHLAEFRIANFRGIQEATLFFNMGVNVLIGENNAFKTAIIDALRICLSYGSQRRDIYVSKADFHVDRTNPLRGLRDIEFDLTFNTSDPGEAALFTELLAITGSGQDLQIHFRYHLVERNGDQRIRLSVWGGQHSGQRISPEQMELFYFIHLGALRDASQSLRPIRGSQLGLLYSKLETDPERQQVLAHKVHDVLQGDVEWRELIQSGQERVNQHLSQTTFRQEEERIQIDFLPFEYSRIVDSLRVQSPVFSDAILREHVGQNQVYFELFQNGLGYNNLIYTAIVLGDLLKKRELRPEAYIALLIEEPEAHLHPQLQNVFFSYLSTLNNMGFQTFITSHSPTITSKAELNSLIVLCKNPAGLKCLSLARTDLTDMNRRYLKKFLDVTKSQLFFARGVILVEGISEALLLPVFSRIIGADYDIERHGIEVVNINGVAFEHFARLFNNSDESRRLGSRCAVITDDDRNAEGEESSRALKALGLAGGFLRVELAERTLEYELFSAGDNKQVLLEVLGQLRPRIRAAFLGQGSLEEAAKEFQEKIASSRMKSEFAHALAIRLEQDEGARSRFMVPEYIRRAVAWTTRGE